MTKTPRALRSYMTREEVYISLANAAIKFMHDAEDLEYFQCAYEAYEQMTGNSFKLLAEQYLLECKRILKREGDLYYIDTWAEDDKSYLKILTTKV